MSMFTLRSSWPVYYVSFAVFIFSAIALVVPSGYSLGAVLLFLGALLYSWRPTAWQQLEKEDWLILLALGFFCLVWVLEIWLHQLGTRELDKPSRFLAAMLVLPLLLRYPPKPEFFWAGVAVGAIATGVWAGWQKLFDGVYRAGGYTQVIQFGNLSMLLGLICLPGIGWAWQQKRYAKGWCLLMALGLVAGVLGSLFSGSRGGWLALLLSLLVLYRGYRDLLKRQYLFALVLLLLIGGGVVYSLPQLGVQQRIVQAVAEVKGYFTENHASSSVGARLEMWRAATLIALEKPFVGWGSEGYLKEKERRAEQRDISAAILIYDHAHNEYLDNWVKRGLPGLLSLLLLYLLPLKLFLRSFSLPCLQARAYAVAGAILCVAYMDFGLTQVFLSHNSGVMVYAFMLVIVWSLHVSTNRRMTADLDRSGA